MCLKTCLPNLVSVLSLRFRAPFRSTLLRVSFYNLLSWAFAAVADTGWAFAHSVLLPNQI